MCKARPLPAFKRYLGFWVRALTGRPGRDELSLEQGPCAACHATTVNRREVGKFDASTVDRREVGKFDATTVEGAGGAPSFLLEIRHAAFCLEETSENHVARSFKAHALPAFKRYLGFWVRALTGRPGRDELSLEQGPCAACLQALPRQLRTPKNRSAGRPGRDELSLEQGPCAACLQALRPLSSDFNPSCKKTRCI